VDPSNRQHLIALQLQTIAPDLARTKISMLARITSALNSEGRLSAGSTIVSYLRIALAERYSIVGCRNPTKSTMYPILRIRTAFSGANGFPWRIDSSTDRSR